MSAENRDLTQTLDALMRKSRISAVTALVMAVVLGGVFTILSYQVYSKQQRLSGLDVEIAQKEKQNRDLTEKIRQNELKYRQGLIDTNRATKTALEQRWRSEIAKENPGAQRVLTKAIEQATESGAGRIVYLQYTNQAALPLMQKLRGVLTESHGFVVPGLEHIDRNLLSKRMDNVVRYFHAGDREIAQSIAEIVNGTLSKDCPAMQPLSAPLQPTRAKHVTPETPVEIWIVNGC